MQLKPTYENLFIKTHSDEDGPFADEGKLGIIYSSKEDLIKLFDFFEKVKKELLDKDDIHMQFRDSFENWSRENHIDLEINVED